MSLCLVLLLAVIGPSLLVAIIILPLNLVRGNSDVLCSRRMMVLKGMDKEKR